MIVSDNGTELTSNAILRWANGNGVGWHYIAPGKPMQNAFIDGGRRQPRRRAPLRPPAQRLAAWRAAGKLRSSGK
jgi:transposase InsO family protein